MCWRCLRRCAAGATEAVMEMTSHALEQERVWGMPVDVAIFTNLTQDHLDYHGTMESVCAAKARLFEGVGAAPPRVAVINADDACGEIDDGCGAGVADGWRYGYGTLAAASIARKRLMLRAGETRFSIEDAEGCCRDAVSADGAGECL